MVAKVRRLYEGGFTALGRLRSEGGATAVEYAVMVALIAAVIVLAVLVLGRATSSTFSQTEHCISVRTVPTCPG